MLKQTIREDDIRAGGITHTARALLSEVTILFPTASEIVSAGIQDNNIVVWAICPDTEDTEFVISVIGTGLANEFTLVDAGKFLATVQLRTANMPAAYSGYLALHLFWRVA